MKKIFKHLPDNSLLALYLTLRAARKGAIQVIISNAALRSHLGMGTLHKSRINKFAATLKPIFPRHAIGTESDGPKNCLFLYLNEKDDPSVKPMSKYVYVTSIPNQATIDKALPIKLVELNI